MSRHDPVVIQAILNVLGRQSLIEGVQLNGRGIVDAIYQEVRRLDRAAIEHHIATQEASSPMAVDARQREAHHQIVPSGDDAVAHLRTLARQALNKPADLDEQTA